MKKTFAPGTGEFYCSIPKKLRVHFGNKRVDFDEAVLIADTLAILYKKKPIELQFANNREHCQTFGWACSMRNIVRINHPDIATLLHELAHIFSPEHGHGPAFGRTLDSCYGFYLSYLKMNRKEKP